MALCGAKYLKQQQEKNVKEKVEGIFNKISSYSTYDRSIKFEWNWRILMLLSYFLFFHVNKKKIEPASYAPISHHLLLKIDFEEANLRMWEAKKVWPREEYLKLLLLLLYASPFSNWNSIHTFSVSVIFLQLYLRRKTFKSLQIYILHRTLIFVVNFSMSDFNCKIY